MARFVDVPAENLAAMIEAGELVLTPQAVREIATIVARAGAVADWYPRTHWKIAELQDGMACPAVRALLADAMPAFVR